jgi:hypothetical protein
MSEKLFKAHQGRPIPLPPSSELSPDNQTIFDVNGAAEHFGWAAEALIEMHETMWPPAAPTDPQAAADVQEALCGWANDPGKVLIRNNDFAHLKDPDFELFLAKCYQRKISPWVGQVFADFRWNHRRKQNEIVLIAGIELQRAIAHGTGLYAGIDRAELEYGEAKTPIRCILKIYKMVEGQRCQFTGEATWDEFYPGVNSGTLWDEKPEVCLTICAEAAGLRRAFPQVGGLYTSFEFTKSRLAPRGGGPAPAGADPDSQASDVGLSDEEVPVTAIGFHRLLWEAGFGDPGKRQLLIDKFRMLAPGLLERDQRGFYAKVLNELRRDPEKWGAATA